jgi:hypothetical protein
MEDGARVRGATRLKRRAKKEAEAKLDGELRDAQRELHKSEKGKKELEEQAKDRLKSQKTEARKVEKKMMEGHKRDLAVMRGDVERIRGEDRQIQLELVRKFRGKARRISKELVETHTAELGIDGREKCCVGEGI